MNIFVLKTALGQAFVEQQQHAAAAPRSCVDFSGIVQPSSNVCSLDLGAPGLQAASTARAQSRQRESSATSRPGDVGEGLKVSMPAL